MDAAIQFNDLIKLAALVAGLWGFYKIVMEIVKAITARHDKEQAWDEAVEKISKEREDIVKMYDGRLDELESKITENHTDTEAKMQEIRTELLLLTECMRAVLDGLHQQGCNGKVTEASKKLDEYLVGLIGK